jgi:hypothetical protein
MPANLSSRDRLVALARQQLGADPASPAGLGEALRGELWARGLAVRRSLRERVVALLHPVGGQLNAEATCVRAR